MLIDERPLALVPADQMAYSESYWWFIDHQVLAIQTGSRRRIPRHAELGLSSTHQVVPARDPWWRRLDDSPWRHVLYVAVLAGVFALALYLTGQGPELP